MVLVDVTETRLEHGVRLPFLPDLDQQLEDLLAVLGKRPHLEIVDGEPFGLESDLRVASRTSRASVSGGKPGGSDFVAIEKAT